MCLFLTNQKSLIKVQAQKLHSPIIDRSPPHRLTLSRNTTLKGRPLENKSNPPLSTREDENLISTSRPFIRLATEVFFKTFIN